MVVELAHRGSDLRGIEIVSFVGDAGRDELHQLAPLVGRERERLAIEVLGCGHDAELTTPPTRPQTERGCRERCPGAPSTRDGRGSTRPNRVAHAAMGHHDMKGRSVARTPEEITKTEKKSEGGK